MRIPWPVADVGIAVLTASVVVGHLFVVRAMLQGGLAMVFGSMAAAGDESSRFGLRVVDDLTGRGVPMVEIESVNHVRFVTDNGGWVAIDEPGWFGGEVFLSVRSHGYEMPKDGLGFTGVHVNPWSGGRETVRIHRVNPAERLYRVTGEGLWRDTVLLGMKTALADPLRNAQVAGQDSAQAAVFGGRIHWFWGDTTRMDQPLGHFRTAGAQAELPGHGGLDPDVGVNLKYWTSSDGFSRPMYPFDPAQPGLVWIDGLVVVPDASGNERMVAHYARMKTLGERLEHGLVVWDAEHSVFERRLVLAADETWRFPRGHPARGQDEGGGYVYCGDNFPDVRVPARFEALLDTASYEAWSCKTGNNGSQPVRKADGALDYGWRRGVPPVTNADEADWLKGGLMRKEECRLLPEDVESGRQVRFHNGASRWNPYRMRWICIAVESGGSTALGEVWYAESRSPTGPWLRARKIVTHDRYSFYNPVHHDFLNQAGGRIIYFEGTCSNAFSGNPDATPRYDYNQVMYRLDLDDPRLAPARQ